MVPRRDIRAFVRRIVAEFRPRRVILFGSYAYGTPTEDSDVDLMVVFPGRGDVSGRSLEIRLRIPRPFALDLLTRTEGELARRLAMNDWFLRDSVAQGKILYESSHAPMARRGRRRTSHRAARTPRAEMTP